MALATIDELAVLCQTTIPAGDPFATALLEHASILVTSKAGHSEWDPITIPPMAKLILLHVAKRCFLNPEQEISLAIAGGPSARNVDEWAAGMKLLPHEEEELLALRGDPITDPYPGLWVIQTTRGKPELQGTEYLPTSTGTPFPYISEDDSFLFGTS